MTRNTDEYHQKETKMGQDEITFQITNAKFLYCGEYHIYAIQYKAI